MTMLIISFMIMSSFIFMQLNHPLSITLNIIIQTLLTCLMVGHLSSTFWFAYILFLIFLGGMLVLFLYITSLAPNEMFSTSLKFIMFLPIMSLTLLMFFMEPYLTSTQINSNDMTPLLESNIKMTQLYLFKLYNNPTHYITIMLMFYLLLTLIVIVKITNIFMGPLRKSN